MKNIIKNECKRTIFILCLFVVVASLIQIYRVNAAYPSAKQVYIPFSKTHTLQEGINLSVISSKWLNNEDVREKYGEYMDLGNSNMKVAYVTVEIQNIAEKEMIVPLYKLYIESDLHYCNGLDLEMYMIDNIYQSVEINLKPKEKVSVSLPYSIYNFQFKKDEWNSIEDYNFYLVNDRYPVKYCWELK